MAVDPYIPDGAVPKVEHVVPLLGIEIVPVTPVGAGLMPGEAISVAPSGMPVWETPEPVPTPSGDVAPMVGVGLAIPVTWAVASLQRTSAASIVINENFIVFSGLPTKAAGSSARRTFLRRKSAAADVQFLIQRLVELVLLGVKGGKLPLLDFIGRRMWKEVLGSWLNIDRRRSSGVRLNLNNR